MSSKLTYILLFNSEVLFPSYNVHTLWLVMFRRIASEGGTPPESYATTRRRILAEHKYVHTPRVGFTYSIIARDMLKKSVQHKLPFANPAVTKATDIFKND